MKKSERKLPPTTTVHSNSLHFRMLAAAGIAVASLALLPLVYLVIRVGGTGAEAWAILRRPLVREVFLNSIILAAATTLLALVIGVPMAWLTTRTDLPMRRFWSVAAILPLAMPSYVMAYAYIALMGPRGAVARALESLGWSGKFPDAYGLPGTVLVIGLINYPFVVLCVRAALARFDPSLEEAAQGMGLGRRAILGRVILPQLRPALASGGLLVALYALSDFGAPAMLQCRTFTRVIHVQYSSFDPSGAALMSLALVALTFPLLGAESLVRGRASLHRAHSAPQRSALPMRLGGWKIPAVFFCGAIFAASTLLPLATLVAWFVVGLTNSDSGERALHWDAHIIWNSSYSALLAAVAAVIAAGPVVVLAARHPGRFARVLDRITYIGNALPGIVIALALVYFGANYAPRWLYQSLPMMILAYVIRFLPQAVGAMRTSMLQINPKLEEAAIGLGRSRPNAFFTVTLPLLTPGILAGGALVFLTTIKELPITLLLHPTDFGTLVEEIWWTTSNVLYARAALPALVLVAVSALSIFLILQREKRGGYG